MPDPKPRRWLQLHLSTLVVLMFVAGGLLWANCSVQVVTFSPRYSFRDPQTGEMKSLDYCVRYEYRGWPRWFQETSSRTGFPDVDPAPRTALFRQHLLANVLICSGLLLAALVLCEFGVYLRQRGIRRSTVVIAALIISASFMLNCMTRLSEGGPPHDKFWGWPFTFAEVDYDAHWPSDLVQFLRCPRWTALLANVFLTTLGAIAAGRIVELLVPRREHHRP